jgi:hypothetical protein
MDPNCSKVRKILCHHEEIMHGNSGTLRHFSMNISYLKQANVVNVTNIMNLLLAQM